MMTHFCHSAKGQIWMKNYQWRVFRKVRKMALWYWQRCKGNSTPSNREKSRANPRVCQMPKRCIKTTKEHHHSVESENRIKITNKFCLWGQNCISPIFNPSPSVQSFMLGQIIQEAETTKELQAQEIREENSPWWINEKKRCRQGEPSECNAERGAGGKHSAGKALDSSEKTLLRVTVRCKRNEEKIQGRGTKTELRVNRYIYHIPTVSVLMY